MKDKIILITGASGGIGSMMAGQFAEKGAILILHYHSNRKGVEKLKSTICGSDHMIVGGDLGNPDSVEFLATSAINRFGKIDVLINNAGLYVDHPISDIDYSDWQKAWQKTLNTNLVGAANLTFIVSNTMIKSGGGKIINISSRGAFRGEPEGPAYGASKAGLNAMGQSLAKALAPHNVYIYTIAPGFVETAMARPYLTSEKKKEILNQSPLGRVAKPEEIANTAIFLANDGTDFLTGCIIDINGASYLRT